MKKLIAVLVIILIAGSAMFYDMVIEPQGLSLRPDAEEKIVSFTAREQPFPEIIFTDMDGDSIEVRSLKEPVVLVHFWATWCAPCLIEFPKIIQLLEDMEGDIALVAVSLDYKTEPLEQFIAKHDNPDLPIHWVHDKGSEIAYRQFLISQLPETLIVTPNRMMHSKIVGDYDWARKDMRKRLTALAAQPIY